MSGGVFGVCVVFVVIIPTSGVNTEESIARWCPNWWVGEIPRTQSRNKVEITKKCWCACETLVVLFCGLLVIISDSGEVHSPIKHTL